MLEILAVAVKPTIIVFLLTSMLSVGASLTIQQIVEPLRNARLVTASMLVSFLLVPLIAVGITRLIQLEEPLKIGLILLSMTAGAEALPKATGIAKGNVPFSVALMFLQVVVSMIYVPLLLTVLLPEVELNHLKLLLKLFFLVLLPLGVGLFLKKRHDTVAEGLHKITQPVSTLALLTLTALVVVVNFAEIVRMAESGAVVAAVIFVIASCVVGYLFGGPGQDTRKTLAIGAAARNMSIALLVASQAFSDPKVVTMITVTTVISLCFILPMAYWFGRRTE